MDWLNTYFINPLVYAEGYNWINTIVFGLIFIISLFIIKKILNKLKIKLNNKFFISLIPFVLLGGVLRALQDTGFFNFLGAFRFLFITPGIYFLIFSIVLISLIIEFKIKKEFIKFFGLFLILIFSIALILKAVNWLGFLIALFLTSIVFGVTFLIFKKQLNKPIFYLPLFAHTLDACSSVTAILIIGGFKEQHVLPNLLLRGNLFWFFIPLKILIVLFVILLIKKEEDANWRWLFLFSIFVLGMGPGTRNSLSILLH